MNFPWALLLLSVFAGLSATENTQPPDDINFYLFYDRKNTSRTDKLVVGDADSVRTSHFVSGQPVIFLQHGFHNRYDEKGLFVAHVKNAYLKMGFVNIIATDWQKYSGAGQPLPVAIVTYLNVETNGSPTAAKALCKMILFLTREKFITGPEQVHLVGHSLGSHVSGLAGRCVKKALASSGRAVDRITALDAAVAVYAYVKPAYRLAPTDASFVDVLHTDIGMAGTDLRLGTADFYANGGGGWEQPNCINVTLDLVSLLGNALAGLCAHDRAYLYYARSILRTQPELYGCRCMTTNWLVLPSYCASPRDVCKDSTLYGEYVPRTAKGTYYVKVDKNLPGLGVLT